jgi:hypothetical protein
MSPTQNLKCILVLIFFAFIACKSTEKEKDKKEYFPVIDLWELVLTDTVIVDYPYDILLIDHSVNRKAFLGYDFQNRKIIEISETGQVLNFFDGLEDEGPNGYGKEMWALTYLQDSCMVVLGTTGFYFYDFKGRLIRKLRHPFRGGMWYNARKKIHPVTIDNVPHVLAILDDNTDLPPVSKDYFKGAYSFTIVNLVSEKYYYIGPLSETKRYGKNYNYINLERLLDVNPVSQHALVTYELEPVVYVFDIKTKQKINSVPLNPDFFKEPIGFPYGKTPTISETITAMAKNSVNYKIFSMNDLILVEYHSGVDAENVTLEEYNSNLITENKKYLLIADTSGNNYKDLEIPAFCRTLNIIIHTGAMWFSAEERLMNTEPDKRTFFVYNLGQKNK